MQRQTRLVPQAGHLRQQRCAVLVVALDGEKLPFGDWAVELQDHVLEGQPVVDSCERLSKIDCHSSNMLIAERQLNQSSSCCGVARPSSVWLNVAKSIPYLRWR